MGSQKFGHDWVTNTQLMKAGGTVVTSLPASAGDAGSQVQPPVGKIPWRRNPWKRAWQPTPVFLAGKSHGQKSLAGYSPWGTKPSDMTEQLTLSLSKFRTI